MYVIITIYIFKSFYYERGVQVRRQRHVGKHLTNAMQIKLYIYTHTYMPTLTV